MGSTAPVGGDSALDVPPQSHSTSQETTRHRGRWNKIFSRKDATSTTEKSSSNVSSLNDDQTPLRPKWTMGILNDPNTDEVPGSVLLLSKVSKFNEPLGLQNAPARLSSSSIPHVRMMSPPPPPVDSKKYSPDGKFVLEPQPHDSPNDPLNWVLWRRDLALLSLGFYCMIGGGMTPILAAGFETVADEFDITVPQVALTLGMYSLGLGLGSVVLSPTAILYGKRPVYLVAAVCFVLSSIWCALSPNLTSLILARVFQGFAVSSVECLPSATIAEIYFLHEKAYRLGVYTLLLLGGKNIVPLVSAVIIGSLGWRWVFWIVSIVVAFAGCLLFLFVPETFWDRTPVPPQEQPQRVIPAILRVMRSFERVRPQSVEGEVVEEKTPERPTSPKSPGSPKARFADQDLPKHSSSEDDSDPDREDPEALRRTIATPVSFEQVMHSRPQSPTAPPNTARLSHDLNADAHNIPSTLDAIIEEDPFRQKSYASTNSYTSHYSTQPLKTYYQSLQVTSGRLQPESWFRVALRPFLLYTHPAILWSSLIYSLSIGWLIVISESVAVIYQRRDTYNFTPLQAGLVYLSPFIGGILGTVVAGKLSDFVVRFMARRNGGVYEPEFRLLMAIPIAISTTIGLMGFGWSAQIHDNPIVPTVFFGIISFGCSLGSTTAITFAVDSYRQYSGEALVTLNFSKNIFHAMVFSLFFNRWLQAEGSREVFLIIGGIQLVCLMSTVPMYIYGKRARMWTVRKKVMEKV
jgi:MFS family permease